LIGVRKQPEDRRFHRHPRGGVTERLERELIDDVTGVANPEFGAHRTARLDRQRVCLQRQSGAHRGNTTIVGTPEEEAVVQRCFPSAPDRVARTGRNREISLMVVSAHWYSSL
jgi:hypothetical protein